MEKCNHEWVEYKQCCYCGAFDNGKKIIEKRTQSNVEDLRQRFSEWYFGIKNQYGSPPLAMQIFYWFDKNLGLFSSLCENKVFTKILDAAKSGRRYESGIDETGFVYIDQLENIMKEVLINESSIDNKKIKRDSFCRDKERGKDDPCKYPIGTCDLCRI